MSWCLRPCPCCPWRLRSRGCCPWRLRSRPCGPRRLRSRARGPWWLRPRACCPWWLWPRPCGPRRLRPRPCGPRRLWPLGFPRWPWPRIASGWSRGRAGHALAGLRARGRRPAPHRGLEVRYAVCGSRRSRACPREARRRLALSCLGRRTGLHVRDDRDGLGVGQARQKRGRDPGGGERAVCLGSARHQACPARTIFPVSLPRGILTAGVCARVLGEWSRAPVVAGGWGWHATKIQARLSSAHKQPGCAHLTSTVAGSQRVGGRTACSHAASRSRPRPGEARGRSLPSHASWAGCGAAKCQTPAVSSNKHRKAARLRNEFRFE